MRAGHLARALAPAALAAVAVAGCAREVPRTSTFLLERETARAFERAFKANHRMATGRSRDDLLVARSARCRKLEPPPRDRPWHWSCRISYRPRGGEGGLAVYRVSVDRRGCFSAVSRAFPPLAYEPILRRRSPNPLARFGSCP